MYIGNWNNEWGTRVVKSLTTYNMNNGTWNGINGTTTIDNNMIKELFGY